jgi:hypothetical protein
LPAYADHFGGALDIHIDAPRPCQVNARHVSFLSWVCQAAWSDGIPCYRC